MRSINVKKAGVLISLNEDVVSSQQESHDALRGDQQADL